MVAAVCGEYCPVFSVAVAVLDGGKCVSGILSSVLCDCCRVGWWEMYVGYCPVFMVATEVWDGGSCV